MKKYFCDGCGEELTEQNKCAGGTVESRLGVELKTKNNKHKMKVELLISTDGSANSGDYCKYCMIDAFNRLDDRPRAA